MQHSYTKRNNQEPTYHDKHPLYPLQFPTAGQSEARPAGRAQRHHKKHHISNYMYKNYVQYGTNSTS